MDLLATLILAHLIADFPLQTNGIFRLKHRHWAGVLLHAAIHGAVAAILLQDPFARWPMLVTLVGVHFTIDWLKLRIDFRLKSLGFILDQITHGLALLLLATWPSEITGVLSPMHLYPALAYALVPSLLMFLSELTADLEGIASHLAKWPVKKTPQIILLSHLAGYPLIVGVVILRFGRWE
jgi:hypothetical protein